MSRRELIAAGAALSIAGRAAARPDKPAFYLGPTSYLDIKAVPVARRAAAARAGGRSDRDTAVALHDLVRDEVRFGFTRGFWDLKASEVLAAGRGYCNTKSTLFVALLRAASIPARQVFVDIDAAVLHGIIDPGTPYVDHSYVEAFLEGEWRATDAYIVDDALFRTAAARVRRESRLLGYGVHATGSNEWNGRSAAFAQYNRLDPRPLGRRHWGVFADVGDFYARADGPWNRLNGLLRTGFGLLAAGANRRADALRRNG